MYKKKQFDVIAFLPNKSKYSAIMQVKQCSHIINVLKMVGLRVKKCLVIMKNLANNAPLPVLVNR